jgi:brefeldin A-inhibited guanine nucleotide-exchange protein
MSKASLDTRSSRNMFLSTALQKILAEKETKKSQHAKLRAACEKALTEINEELGKGGAEAAAAHVGPNSPLPPPQPEDKVVNADKYFTPFRLSCESKSPRIIRTALDCLQKLMAYGHVSGNMLAEVEGFPDAMRLVDLIVDIVW